MIHVSYEKNLHEVLDYINENNYIKIKQIQQKCFQELRETVTTENIQNIQRDYFAEGLITQQMKEIILTNDMSGKIVIAGRYDLMNIYFVTFSYML